MNRRLALIGFLVLCMLVASGCANANDVAVHHGGAGFWSGLWDGITEGFAFIAHLFGAHYGIYEVHNNGGWYDFGFVLGSGTLFGGVFEGSRSRR
jgi:hypothetical protein